MIVNTQFDVAPARNKLDDSTRNPWRGTDQESSGHRWSGDRGHLFPWSNARNTAILMFGQSPPGGNLI